MRKPFALNDLLDMIAQLVSNPQSYYCPRKTV